MLEDIKQDVEDQAGEPLLVANDIAYVKRGKTILTEVSLQLSKGEIITLIGPNGAGKTSLVRILLGLAKNTSGSVERKHGLVIGYVPQRIQVPEVMPLRVYDFLNVSGDYDAERCQQRSPGVRGDRPPARLRKHDTQDCACPSARTAPGIRLECGP